MLADCFGRSPFGTDRLWPFPFDGGSPTAPTPALRPHGLFQGYVNAWQLDGRHLQADNAHDTLSIVRQFRDGSRRTVTVPGPAGISDWIVSIQQAVAESGAARAKPRASGHAVRNARLTPLLAALRGESSTHSPRPRADFHSRLSQSRGVWCRGPAKVG